MQQLRPYVQRHSLANADKGLVLMHRYSRTNAAAEPLNKPCPSWLLVDTRGRGVLRLTHPCNPSDDTMQVYGLSGNLV